MVAATRYSALSVPRTPSYWQRALLGLSCRKDGGGGGGGCSSGGERDGEGSQDIESKRPGSGLGSGTASTTCWIWVRDATPPPVEGKLHERRSRAVGISLFSLSSPLLFFNFSVLKNIGKRKEEMATRGGGFTVQEPSY